MIKVGNKIARMDVEINTVQIFSELNRQKRSSRLEKIVYIEKKGKERPNTEEHGADH